MTLLEGLSQTGHRRPSHVPSFGPSAMFAGMAGVPHKVRRVYHHGMVVGWRYATSASSRSLDRDLESTPGKVGARASQLSEILEQGHYDVKLSEEEMHRIMVWLDSYSPFYGVYEPEAGKLQLRGEIFRPALE